MATGGNDTFTSGPTPALNSTSNDTTFTSIGVTPSVTSTTDTSSLKNGPTGTTNSSQNSNQLLLAIVFSAFGCIMLVVLIAGIAICCIRRRRRKGIRVRPGKVSNNEKDSVHQWPSTLPLGADADVSDSDHSHLIGKDAETGNRTVHYQLPSEPRVSRSMGQPRGGIHTQHRLDHNSGPREAYHALPPSQQPPRLTNPSNTLVNPFDHEEDARATVPTNPNNKTHEHAYDGVSRSTEETLCLEVSTEPLVNPFEHEEDTIVSSSRPETKEREYERAFDRDVHGGGESRATTTRTLSVASVYSQASYDALSPAEMRHGRQDSDATMASLRQIMKDRASASSGMPDA